MNNFISNLIIASRRRWRGSGRESAPAWRGRCPGRPGRKSLTVKGKSLTVLKGKCLILKDLFPCREIPYSIREIPYSIMEIPYSKGKSTIQKGAQVRAYSLLGSHKLYAIVWRHYLSHAACLIRPRFCYACFAVSRIAILCYMIRHF